MSALPLLTSSRLKTARACQRLHFYEYGLGFRPARDAEALRFGTLIHLGLEAWWKGNDDRLGDALQVLELEPSDPFDLARARAMMVGYDARWLADATLYAVVAVEARFEAPLVNPESGRASQTWNIGGKLDVVVRELATGRYGIVEHKTSSEDLRPGSDYWKRLRLDGQVSVYYSGAQVLIGQPVDFCLYDVLSKPSLKPYKKTAELKHNKDGTLRAGQRLEDETPSEFEARILEDISTDPAGYFGRSEVVRLDGELEEAMADIWQFGRMLRENDLRGFHPRNVDACIRFGRPCPFFGVCAGEASLDDQELYRRIPSPHPELDAA
ncbi:MAG: PD-(D/E)XK nuclease family protein [Deltaproteobacteria bacterium]